MAFKDTGFGKALLAVYKFLIAFTQFLDGPNGKFSSKRLALLAVIVVGIIRLFSGHPWESAGCGVFGVFMGWWITQEDKEFNKKVKP